MPLREDLQRDLGSTYTLERELGGGGMSRVFVARDATLERTVVVKVLSPELAAGISAERFTREIKVAASLQQANIVPVLAAGSTREGLPYYTMPFVEGQSLRSRLATGQLLPVSEIVGIVRDVAKALAYAHERGIVHRDIKPDNILLSGGTAVVTDFGIAKAVSASRQESNATLTQLGTSIGTPAYMAPEQAAGDPDVDHRADIYALGCVTYELLSGHPVFANRTPQRMLAAHMSEAPQPIGDVRADAPVALADLVMRCLAKEPDARPQSASDVVRTLDAVTSGGGLPAMPAILMGGPGMLRRALAFYAAAFVIVAVLAKAAILVVGLPDWVFPGAIGIMLLGLPVLLFTAYVQRVARRVLTTTPALTPGGTPSLPQSTMATLAMKASPHVSWRRATMGGVYAVVAFALLVAAFMTLRALGIGPAGSLLAAGAIEMKQLLLVTDFKVSSADSSLGRVLGDATKATLAQSSVISIATPEAVASALRRMQRPTNSTLEFPLARELALRNNIKVIVDGEVNGLGAAGFIVTLKLVTTDSARELASFRETAADARGLIDAVDKLSRNLRGRLGESLRSVHATLPFYDATTGSLDALKKYTEASRIADIENDYLRAIPLLREAVDIDSTFAAGWRKLAIVMNNAGQPRVSIDSALRKAYQHRDRLGDSERDYVIAAYYGSGPGRDRGKAVAAYESMLRRGDTSGAANNLGLTLMTRREYARAESLYRAQERNCQGCFRPLYGNLGVALLRQGKFDASDSVGLAAIARFPNFDGMRRNMLNTTYLRGDTGRFRRIVDSMASRPDSASKAWARLAQQMFALRDGKLREFQRLEALGRADSASATPRQRLSWATEVSDAYVGTQLLDRKAEVERRLDAGLAAVNLSALPETQRPYFGIARVYAWAGRPDKAREYVNRFDADVRDTAYKRDLQDDRANALGEVLLAEHRAAEALAEFRRADRKPDGPSQSCNICATFQEARAFDAAGQADSALVRYERVIAEYSYDRLTFDRYFLAPFSKRVGELYEQRGNTAKAAKYYRDFVNLWAHADTELQPQVAEVRRRLARLADVEAKR
jgi:tRNA A-37 threonylcarbamoyl transferase component Bud32/tetratricopeptide (TPR) repeat protein